MIKFIKILLFIFIAIPSFSAEESSSRNTLLTVEAPVFTPASGSYTSTQNVSITTKTPDAKIYFTTDGSEPSIDKTLYTSPISVSFSQTIKAIAVKEGYKNSEISKAEYKIALLTVATPYFSLSQGKYTKSQDVKIFCATPGVKIYFTTDGSEPSSDSYLYTSDITISKTQTLKAIAIKEGYNNSKIASVEYTIDLTDYKLYYYGFDLGFGVSKISSDELLNVKYSFMRIAFEVNGYFSYYFTYNIGIFGTIGVLFMQGKYKYDATARTDTFQNTYINFNIGASFLFDNVFVDPFLSVALVLASRLTINIDENESVSKLKDANTLFGIGLNTGYRFALGNNYMTIGLGIRYYFNKLWKNTNQSRIWVLMLKTGIQF